jgi:hypothetical protein
VSLFCTFDATDEAGVVSETGQNDFSMQLSSFVASMVADVPSAAHWALDLAEFDFSSAAATLVTTIPGLHGCLCSATPPPIVVDAVKEVGIANLL